MHKWKHMKKCQLLTICLCFHPEKTEGRSNGNWMSLCIHRLSLTRSLCLSQISSDSIATHHHTKSMAVQWIPYLIGDLCWFINGSCTRLDTLCLLVHFSHGKSHLNLSVAVSCCTEVYVFICFKCFVLCHPVYSIDEPTEHFNCVQCNRFTSSEWQ